MKIRGRVGWELEQGKDLLGMFQAKVTVVFKGLWYIEIICKKLKEPSVPMAQSSVYSLLHTNRLNDTVMSFTLQEVKSIWADKTKLNKARANYMGEKSVQRRLNHWGKWYTTSLSSLFSTPRVPWKFYENEEQDTHDDLSSSEEV